MNEQKTNTTEKIFNDAVSAQVEMGQHKYDELTLDDEPFAPLGGKSGDVQELTPQMRDGMTGRYGQGEAINSSEQVKNPNILKRIGGFVTKIVHGEKPS